MFSSGRMAKKPLIEPLSSTYPIANNKVRRGCLTKHNDTVNIKSKLIAAVAAAAIIIGFSTMSASAWNHMGPMIGNGYGMMSGAGVTVAENQQFRAETKKIRLAIAADQAELKALFAGSNADSARVRELSESIVKNQITIQDMSGSYGSGNGYNMDRMHMRGPGMMNDGYYGCNW